MKNAALITLAAMTFTLSTGFGGCHHRNYTPEERAKHAGRMATAVVDDVMDDVDATDDQRAKAHAVKESVLKEAAIVFEQHDMAKAELWAQWQSKQPDASRVHGIIDDRMDAFRKLLHKVADGLIELHAILTPEQRAEITNEWKR
jgi:periplasmic protein CpxP/Spy